MKKLITILVCFGTSLFAGVPRAYTLSLLVSQGRGWETSQGMIYHGYGYDRWTNMTSALDTATENNVDVILNFEDLNLILSYDALWLDIREPFMEGSLSTLEENNIRTFIGTGRRVVMIGENYQWESWNSDILGLVGGTIATSDPAEQAGGRAYCVIDNELTYGVNSVVVQYGGLVSGGIALFDQNFATLWGDNVLTILDTHMNDRDWAFSGNPQFFTNVANWVAGKPPEILEPIPEPATMFLLSTGLVGLAAFGKRLRRRDTITG